MMHYYIVTGNSKGIGLEICNAVAASKKNTCTLIGLGRTPPPSNCVAGAAAVKFVALDFLESAERIGQVCREQVWPLVKGDAASVSLVLNAGMLSIGELGRGRGPSLAREIAVNGTAPLVLLDSFVEAFGQAQFRCQVCVITSGLANSASAKLSGYCAGKSALEMGLQCFREEQKEDGAPGRNVVVQLISPGIVATSMQRALREEFSFFREYHAKGKGATAAETGTRIAQCLLSDQFGTPYRVDWFEP